MIFRIYDSKRMDMYIQTIRQNQLARFRNVSWHVYIIYLFIPCRCRRGYIFTRYCRTLSNVSQIIWTGSSVLSISVLLIREMEVFSTMTLVESGGLLMHVSLELLGNFVIITEHALTISLMSVTLFMLQEMEGLCSIIREKNKSWSLSP